MRSEETKEIAGDTYTVRMLDPDVAFDMFVDLFDMLGTSLAAILPAYGVGEDTEREAIGAALRVLVGKVDKGIAKDMIHKLAKATDVNGKPLEPQYKIHFMGRIGAMSQWLAFAIQAQFRDFRETFGSTLMSEMLRTRAPEGSKEG